MYKYEYEFDKENKYLEIGLIVSCLTKTDFTRYSVKYCTMDISAEGSHPLSDENIDNILKTWRVSLPELFRLTCRMFIDQRKILQRIWPKVDMYDEISTIFDTYRTQNAKLFNSATPTMWDVICMLMFEMKRQSKWLQGAFMGKNKEPLLYSSVVKCNMSYANLVASISETTE